VWEFGCHFPFHNFHCSSHSLNSFPLSLSQTGLLLFIYLGSGHHISVSLGQKKQPIRDRGEKTRKKVILFLGGFVYKYCYIKLLLIVILYTVLPFIVFFFFYLFIPV